MWVAPTGMLAARGAPGCRWRLHQLWVRVRRVRAEPARAGSAVFGGVAALRCLADSESPSQKIKIQEARGTGRHWAFPTGTGHFIYTPPAALRLLPVVYRPTTPPAVFHSTCCLSPHLLSITHMLSIAPPAVYHPPAAVYRPPAVYHPLFCLSPLYLPAGQVRRR
jgi:hypothetical protein